MNLTRIIVLAAAVMIPATWTMANAGEPAAAPAGEKTEKTTKSKKSEGAGGEAKAAGSEKAAGGEKKAEKK
jgi:hypothetical protein